MEKLKGILLILVLVAFDQLSKWYFMEEVLRPFYTADPKPRALLDWIAFAPMTLPYVEIHVTSFFNIVSVWNEGVSFGLFGDGSDFRLYTLIGLSFAIVIGFFVWMLQTDDEVHHFGIVLVIAGAIGNVIDRFRFGAVFDFLDFHIMGYHWPAFNLADSMICAGVFILMIYAFLFEKKSS